MHEVGKRVKGWQIAALAALMPQLVHASFIETTIGTAVVNDATAANYNPAALVMLKNPQIIPLGNLADFRTRFYGQSTRIATGITETGGSSTNTRYYSPTIYFGLPASEKISLGLAVLANDANRSVDDHAILRYVQASNEIQDYDVIPAVGVKINDYFSLGGGIVFSYADFHLQPITAFPGSNIADSQSNNHASGSGLGVDAGFLLKPQEGTLIGMNYRSMTTYRLSGTSQFAGPPSSSTSDYHFKLWTPARTTLSMNQFITRKFAVISTVQRIQWSAITNVHSYNIASASGGAPVILNGTIPYYLRDAWLLTLGVHYHLAPWVLRAAAAYNQSPGNPHYQIVHGNSTILGASASYEFNQTFTLDGSYAHAFIANENITINGSRFKISGVNQGLRNAVSLKLTINL